MKPKIFMELKAKIKILNLSKLFRKIIAITVSSKLSVERSIIGMGILFNLNLISFTCIN